MFFDARKAKLLKPGEHMLVDGCSGLRLVVSASRKSWTYRYKTGDGKIKQVAIGQWPAMSVQSAAAAWQELRTLRDGGADPAAQRREAKKPTPAPKTYTVRDLVQGYVDGHLMTSRKPEGAEAARRSLQRLLDESPDFAGMHAALVNRSDAFDILDARKGKPTAAQKLRALLGAAWDYALDAGRLDGDVPNWWRAVMKGRLKSRGKIVGGQHVGQQRRVLRQDEVAELLAWLPHMHDIGQDAVVMYLWTCARGVEIFGMRPEHIRQEADGWWWTVPKAQTKNARYEKSEDLRVPLIGRSLEVVRRRLGAVGESGWLFETVQKGKVKQYSQHFFSTYIYSLQPYSEKVARRDGEGLVIPVTNWTPHSLRRTGRTLLASLGCPDEIAEAIMGHMPQHIVGVYNLHSYDAERRLWLGKLDQLLHSLHFGLPARP